MNLRRIAVWLLIAAPALGLVNLKGGYTSTQGELGDRYKGGFGGMIELEIPLPAHLAIVPMGGFTQLGADQEFTELLNEYIGQYWPPGVPLPPELQQLGDINSSMYFFGGALRFYPVKNPGLSFYGEGGLGYYYRDMEAKGVPLSTIGTFFPEFKEFAVEPVKGAGIHIDVGLELISISPISPQFGARYIHAFGIGRTTVDDFLEENVPGFTAPDSKNVDLFFVYGGLGIF